MGPGGVWPASRMTPRVIAREGRKGNRQAEPEHGRGTGRRTSGRPHRAADADDDRDAVCGPNRAADDAPDRGRLQATLALARERASASRVAVFGLPGESRWIEWRRGWQRIDDDPRDPRAGQRPRGRGDFLGEPVEEADVGITSRGDELARRQRPADVAVDREPVQAPDRIRETRELDGAVRDWGPRKPTNGLGLALDPPVELWRRKNELGKPRLWGRRPWQGANGGASLRLPVKGRNRGRENELGKPRLRRRNARQCTNGGRASLRLPVERREGRCQRVNEVGEPRLSGRRPWQRSGGLPVSLREPGKATRYRLGPDRADNFDVLILGRLGHTSRSHAASLPRFS
jgi:hypothetical protein